MEENNHSGSRRKLLKGLAALPVVTAFGLSGFNKPEDRKELISDEGLRSLQDLKGKLPKGKLGNLEISRLVLGCNPMGGWAHSRDLDYVGQLCKHWHTDQKMKETFAIAEKAGINTTNLVAEMYPVFNAYKKETGSTMQSICQGMLNFSGDIHAPVKKVIDYGATAVYIQGWVTDLMAEKGRFDDLQKAIELIRKAGLPAGIGSHSVQSVIRTREKGIKPDFYYKTFHHDRYWSAHPRENRKEYEVVHDFLPGHNQFHDNIWDLFPEQTVETFKNIDVPLFGFKIMAAGAIKPSDGVRYAFENGADFVCMGMFDFQVVEDVNTVLSVLGSLGERKRPWRA
jgi:hypothetical protein